MIEVEWLRDYRTTGLTTSMCIYEFYVTHVVK